GFGRVFGCAPLGHRWWSSCEPGCARGNANVWSVGQPDAQMQTPPPSFAPAEAVRGHPPEKVRWAHLQVGGWRPFYGVGRSNWEAFDGRFRREAARPGRAGSADLGGDRPGR